MSPRFASALRCLLPLALLAAAPPQPAPAPQDKPLDLSLVPSRTASASSSGTRCELCHTPDGWQDAHFPHDRTGFPLEGAHRSASCKACHTTHDFQAPLPRQCAGCHRDTHAGEFGQRCEGCHETTRWESRFNADAHRRTNFPLTGRHALLPCQECHVDQRGPAFERSTVPCIGCHQRDYERTALTSLDHTALGFSTDCRQCHEPSRFIGGRYPGHDACFQISRGEHAGLACRRCHTSLTGVATPGACSTHTAACSGCHEHTCSEMDEEHGDVPGYQCKDQKCYECHRFSVKP
jgi:hypothetical protein